MMRLCCKSFLAISVLLCLSLLFTAVNGVVATANPGCEPAYQRTISLAVENKAGAPIDNLRLEDLSLLEYKTPREILKLESKTNEALSVAILIDTSLSQERSLPQMKLTAQKFVEAILKASKDRAAVVSFTGEATVEESLTNDLASLQAAISRVRLVRPPGYLGGGIVISSNPPVSNPNEILAGSTAIWDAVWVTTDEILKADADSRRAIVLLTDGEDTASKKKLSEAIEEAARYDVPVFAIGIIDKSYGSPNRKSLNKLAEETGGRAFFPKKPEELPEILRQIEQELRSRYLLTYCASGNRVANTASRLSKIKVQLKNPQSQAPDLRLLYRRYGL